jgi:hypothetical protein
MRGLVTLFIEPPSHNVRSSAQHVTGIEWSKEQ